MSANTMHKDPIDDSSENACNIGKTKIGNKDGFQTKNNKESDTVATDEIKDIESFNQTKDCPCRMQNSSCDIQNPICQLHRQAKNEDEENMPEYTQINNSLLDKITIKVIFHDLA